MSVDGVLGREARRQHLLMTSVWKKSYIEVMGWVRYLAILRAINLCLHGSRIKWRRVMDINDGAGLPGNMD